MCLHEQYWENDRYFMHTETMIIEIIYKTLRLRYGVLMNSLIGARLMRGSRETK